MGPLSALSSASNKHIESRWALAGAILKLMLRYHVAFYLPRAADQMVVAEALDFPGAASQGFDLAEARLMISSALEELAEMLLEEGKPLPTPNPEASAPDADLVELVPLSVRAGISRP